MATYRASVIRIYVEERSHYNDTNTNADWSVVAEGGGRYRKWTIGTGPIGGESYLSAKRLADELYHSMSRDFPRAVVLSA